MINEIIPFAPDTTDDLESDMIIYDDLEPDELELLLYYNRYCLHSDPKNKVLYQAKIKYIKSLL